jgi:polyphosphate kinase 2 (PPK2 family)
MGNRCSRWVARTVVDGSTKNLWFPLSAKFIEHYLDRNSRAVIVAMGFIRSVLPFAFSFQGSRIGRQLTFNTYTYANFRWKPVQSVMKFNQHAGVYQDTVLDPELESIAHEVAVAIGHGKDPVETREKMALLKFKVIGSGQGGYAVYRRLDLDMARVYQVHVTPYGPSILDEMPRYVVLERNKLYLTKQVGWEVPGATILDAALPPEASICGFTYSGAFFKSQEWAALTFRFNETLADYATACQRLATVRSLKGENSIRTPPTDVARLKKFIRSGHLPRKKRKDNKRWKEIAHEIKAISKLVAKYQKEGNAPKRVILYLEGLDCSAKSSTGGLVMRALEDCGYVVRTAQHNRPPTPEQCKKPWMDRNRFEYPEDVYEYGEDIPEYTALVWDRGPGGDFVYGKFSELTTTQKMEKYEEFRMYDAVCRDKGVLFCKLLFVADKDSIASTLGKRLAHKRIARDLRTWLDANSFEHAREGMDEIEAHIDPTDFVAFNNFKPNLSIFTDFARNTDNVGHVGLQSDSTIGYHNPWNVVNTCKRHPARLALLKTFERQLKRFAKDPEERVSVADRLLHFFQLSSLDGGVIRPVPKNYVEERDNGLSIRAIFQSMLLAGILYFYAYITWKFDMKEYA